MAKKQGYDITGQRFGKLVVLGKGESKGPGRTAWRCRCDCGNEKTIRGDALKSGSAKSCGSCKGRGQAIDAMLVMDSVPMCEVQKRASEAGLTFGEYTAREYARRMMGGG